MQNITVKQAVTEDEIRAVFAIRKEVFIDEEKLFRGSDVDGNDKKSFHLIAMIDDAVVGTVRLFPLGHADVWEAGRIAVRKECRGMYVGLLLARETVKFAKSKNCKRLLAIVQKPAVNLCRRVGLKPIGHEINYLGISHQTMEADFDAVD
jgi:putative N-acetyltransferase (TIGR04045 family)